MIVNQVQYGNIIYPDVIKEAKYFKNLFTKRLRRSYFYTKDNYSTKVKSYITKSLLLTNATMLVRCIIPNLYVYAKLTVRKLKIHRSIKRLLNSILDKIFNISKGIFYYLHADYVYSKIIKTILVIFAHYFIFKIIKYLQYLNHQYKLNKQLYEQPIKDEECLIQYYVNNKAYGYFANQNWYPIKIKNSTHISYIKPITDSIPPYIFNNLTIYEPFAGAGIFSWVASCICWKNGVAPTIYYREINPAHEEIYRSNNYYANKVTGMMNGTTIVYEDPPFIDGVDNHFNVYNAPIVILKRTPNFIPSILLATPQLAFYFNNKFVYLQDCVKYKHIIISTLQLRNRELLCIKKIGQIPIRYTTNTPMIVFNALEMPYHPRKPLVNYYTIHQGQRKLYYYFQRFMTHVVTYNSDLQNNAITDVIIIGGYPGLGIRQAILFFDPMIAIEYHVYDPKFGEASDWEDTTIHIHNCGVENSAHLDHIVNNLVNVTGGTVAIFTDIYIDIGSIEKQVDESNTFNIAFSVINNNVALTSCKVLWRDEIQDFLFHNFKYIEEPLFTDEHTNELRIISETNGSRYTLDTTNFIWFKNYYLQKCTKLKHYKTYDEIRHQENIKFCDQRTCLIPCPNTNHKRLGPTAAEETIFLILQEAGARVYNRRGMFFNSFLIRNKANIAISKITRGKISQMDNRCVLPYYIRNNRKVQVRIKGTVLTDVPLDDNNVQAVNKMFPAYKNKITVRIKQSNNIHDSQRLLRDAAEAFIIDNYSQTIFYFTAGGRYKYYNSDIVHSGTIIQPGDMNKVCNCVPWSYCMIHYDKKQRTGVDVDSSYFLSNNQIFDSVKQHERFVYVFNDYVPQTNFLDSWIDKNYTMHVKDGESYQHELSLLKDRNFLFYQGVRLDGTYETGFVKITKKKRGFEFNSLNIYELKYYNKIQVLNSIGNVKYKPDEFYSELLFEKCSGVNLSTAVANIILNHNADSLGVPASRRAKVVILAKNAIRRYHKRIYDYDKYFSLDYKYIYKTSELKSMIYYYTARASIYTALLLASVGVSLYFTRRLNLKLAARIQALITPPNKEFIIGKTVFFDDLKVINIKVGTFYNNLTVDQNLLRDIHEKYMDDPVIKNYIILHEKYSDLVGSIMESNSYKYLCEKYHIVKAENSKIMKSLDKNVKQSYKYLIDFINNMNLKDNLFSGMTRKQIINFVKNTKYLSVGYEKVRSAIKYRFVLFSLILSYFFIKILPYSINKPDMYIQSGRLIPIQEKILYTQVHLMSFCPSLLEIPYQEPFSDIYIRDYVYTRRGHRLQFNDGHICEPIYLYKNYGVCSRFTGFYTICKHANVTAVVTRETFSSVQKYGYGTASLHDYYTFYQLLEPALDYLYDFDCVTPMEFEDWLKTQTPQKRAQYKKDIEWSFDYLCSQIPGLRKILYRLGFSKLELIHKLQLIKWHNRLVQANNEGLNSIIGRICYALGKYINNLFGGNYRLKYHLKFDNNYYFGKSHDTWIYASGFTRSALGDVVYLKINQLFNNKSYTCFEIDQGRNDYHMVVGAHQIFSRIALRLLNEVPIGFEEWMQNRIWTSEGITYDQVKWLMISTLGSGDNHTTLFNSQFQIHTMVVATLEFARIKDITFEEALKIYFALTLGDDGLLFVLTQHYKCFRQCIINVNKLLKMDLEIIERPILSYATFCSSSFYPCYRNGEESLFLTPMFGKLLSRTFYSYKNWKSVNAIHYRREVAMCLMLDFRHMPFITKFFQKIIHLSKPNWKSSKIVDRFLKRKFAHKQEVFPDDQDIITEHPDTISTFLDKYYLSKLDLLEFDGITDSIKSLPCTIHCKLVDHCVCIDCYGCKTPGEIAAKLKEIEFYNSDNFYFNAAHLQQTTPLFRNKLHYKINEIDELIPHDRYDQEMKNYVRRIVAFNPNS